MRELAQRGFRVLAYDRVGYGRSDGRAPGRATVETNAGELLGLLAALDLRDVTLVGASYGGATAIAAAKRDPSRLARLVLVGSVGPGIEQRGGPARAGRRLPRRPGALVGRARAAAQPTDPCGVPRSRVRARPGPGLVRVLAEANFARPHTPQDVRLRGPGPRRRGRPRPEPDLAPDPRGAGRRRPTGPAGGRRGDPAPRPARRAPMVPRAGHAIPITHAAWLAEAVVEFAGRPVAERAAAPGDAPRGARRRSDHGWLLTARKARGAVLDDARPAARATAPSWRARGCASANRGVSS